MYSMGGSEGQLSQNSLQSLLVYYGEQMPAFYVLLNPIRLTSSVSQPETLHSSTSTTTPPPEKQECSTSTLTPLQQRPDYGDLCS